MKGILIDPGKRSVEEVESDFELGQLHELVGAETLDFAHPFGPEETVIVDDEGIAHELPFFLVEGYRWPLYGRAVICGRGPQGETVGTRLRVEEVFELVRWNDS